MSIGEVLLYSFSIGVFGFAIHLGTSSFLSFRRNLRFAQDSGIPYVCRSMAEYNYFFLIIQPIITPIIKLLPSFLNPSGYLEIYCKDWRITAKYQKHAILGADVYWNVSPGDLFLEIADAKVYNDVMSRRLDFPKQLKFLASIQLFGPNIVACEEETWKRHRHVISPRYNEDLHSFVWKHATILAKEMLVGWNKTTVALSSKIAKENQELRDLNTLALRVVAGAAFEVMVPFSTGDSSEVDTNIAEASRFSDSLQTIISNLITLMIFPRWLIRLSSKRGRELTGSFENAVGYMDRMLQQKIASGEKPGSRFDGSFLTGLTAALVVPKGAPIGPHELAYDEVTGNLFLMALAGSETTADTLHFALILLALHQDKQAWVVEQLDSVLQECGAQWDYREAYPKLKHLHYAMLETLRLYPPSPVMVRWTADHGQTLLIEGRTIYLPPKTTTVASLTSLHYNPKYWGETASQFLPERWAEVSSRPEGCFSAFGHGQRACLGRRFSEAEFMAVVSTVLKDYRVELRPIDQETPDMTRHRVIKALDDSTTYMTMSVGGAVPLSFVKR